VRNVILDYSKLLLVILVILIHMNPGSLEFLDWGIKNGVARIAVPSFLIINGYYFAEIIYNKAKVKRYIIRLIIIYSVWTFVYSGFIVNSLADASPADIFYKCTDIILAGYYHLWYIACLIWAALLLYLLRNVRAKVVLLLAIGLFLAGCIFTKLYLFDKGLYDYIENIMPSLFEDSSILNIFAIGFPFLAIGYYINKNKQTINLISKSTLLILLVFSFLLLLLESYFSIKYRAIYNIAYGGAFHFILPLICPLFFIYIMKFPVYRESDGFISKLASGIYFIHPMLIMILSLELSHYKFFAVILFLSMIVATGLIHLNKKIRLFL